MDGAGFNYEEEDYGALDEAEAFLFDQERQGGNLLGFFLYSPPYVSISYSLTSSLATASHPLQSLLPHSTKLSLFINIFQKLKRIS
jgi:hypothetical protein